MDMSSGLLLSLLKTTVEVLYNYLVLKQTNKIKGVIQMELNTRE